MRIHKISYKGIEYSDGKAFPKGETMKKISRHLIILVCAVLASLVFIGCSSCGCNSCADKEKNRTKYEIVAEYAPENRTLAGTAKVTFENTTNTEISALKFQIYPNAYRKDALYKPVSTAYESSAYYAGESYGEMVISSVNGSKNWELMGEDKNILCAYLERSLFPGEKVVLDIGFMTKLASVNHRTGITRRTVNLGNFFPILCGIKNDGFYECIYYSDGDPFFSDCADFKLRLTLPKEYEVAATGTIEEERMLESKRVYTMSASKVRDFALVLAPDYKTLQTTVNGKTVFYYYYADEKPEESLLVAKEAFAFYEKEFGVYPYASYTVAETGFCLGGMEYPRLVMISDAVKGEERAKVIAHETAHQWWYAVVGSDQTENAWQDEGLAEYSTVLFFEEYEKYGFTREQTVMQALKEYRSYYDVYGSVLGRTDTRMTRNLKDYISDYEYRCLAYDKSLVMFDTLRKSVGNKKFTAGLKRYYEACAYKTATVGDLVGGFERVGLDVGGFFESFLEGKAIL